ncbi:MAG: thymidine phosphorylase family protein, partial [Micropepsaceae bacterium]
MSHSLQEADAHAPLIRARRMGIDTYQEPVAFMRADCHVCRSEGFQVQARVKVSAGERSVIATLNVVSESLLPLDEAGLSEAAWRELRTRDGDALEFAHPEPLQSFSNVRRKIYGLELEPEAYLDVVRDIVAGRYSHIELAAFLTTCAGDRMSLNEVVSLTRAMAAAGSTLSWPSNLVVDKHCIGGLPGNRTTPIVVAIAAAAGLTMPKTSSRAITSPAGTADVMETLAPVALDLPAMRRVVEQEGGCIVWGGAMDLSPADDILIQVERPLDFDSDGQLVASVLSKKLAAGSTHVVIDVPVGPTAKVRSQSAAKKLIDKLTFVGTAVGLEIRAVETAGMEPVGAGIGPALEARDVVAVLKGEKSAPSDLRERALRLAAEVLRIGRKVTGEGIAEATRYLDSGEAWRKFQAICEAQGGVRMPP